MLTDKKQLGTSLLVREKTLICKEFGSEAAHCAQVTHTHPVPDVKETLLTGQVEHQQESHGVSEESCSEAAKPKIIWQT